MDLEGSLGPKQWCGSTFLTVFLDVPAGTLVPALVPAGLWQQFCSGESRENKREEVFPQRMNGFFTSSIHSQYRGIFFLTDLLQRLCCVGFNARMFLMSTPESLIILPKFNLF